MGVKKKEKKTKEREGGGKGGSLDLDKKQMIRQRRMRENVGSG